MAGDAALLQRIRTMSVLTCVTMLLTGVMMLLTVVISLLTAVMMVGWQMAGDAALLLAQVLTPLIRTSVYESLRI